MNELSIMLLATAALDPTGEYVKQITQEVAQEIVDKTVESALPHLRAFCAAIIERIDTRTA